MILHFDVILLVLLAWAVAGPSIVVAAANDTTTVPTLSTSSSNGMGDGSTSSSLTSSTTTVGESSSTVTATETSSQGSSAASTQLTTTTTSGLETSAGPSSGPSQTLETNAFSAEIDSQTGAMLNSSFMTVPSSSSASANSKSVGGSDTPVVGSYVSSSTVGATAPMDTESKTVPDQSVVNLGIEPAVLAGALAGVAVVSVTLFVLVSFRWRRGHWPGTATPSQREARQRRSLGARNVRVENGGQAVAALASAVNTEQDKAAAAGAKSSSHSQNDQHRQHGHQNRRSPRTRKQQSPRSPRKQQDKGRQPAPAGVTPLILSPRSSTSGPAGHRRGRERKTPRKSRYPKPEGVPIDLTTVTAGARRTFVALTGADPDGEELLFVAPDAQFQSQSGSIMISEQRVCFLSQENMRQGSAIGRASNPPPTVKLLDLAQGGDGKDAESQPVSAADGGCAVQFHLNSYASAAAKGRAADAPPILTEPVEFGSREDAQNFVSVVLAILKASHQSSSVACYARLEVRTQTAPGSTTSNQQQPQTARRGLRACLALIGSFGVRLEFPASSGWRAEGTKLTFKVILQVERRDGEAPTPRSGARTLRGRSRSGTAAGSAVVSVRLTTQTAAEAREAAEFMDHVAAKSRKGRKWRGAKPSESARALFAAKEQAWRENSQRDLLARSDSPVAVLEDEVLTPADVDAEPNADEEGFWGADGNFYYYVWDDDDANNYEGELVDASTVVPADGQTIPFLSTLDEQEADEVSAAATGAVDGHINSATAAVDIDAEEEDGSAVISSVDIGVDDGATLIHAPSDPNLMNSASSDRKD